MLVDTRSKPEDERDRRVMKWSLAFRRVFEFSTANVARRKKRVNDETASFVMNLFVDNSFLLCSLLKSLLRNVEEEDNKNNLLIFQSGV